MAVYHSIEIPFNLQSVPISKIFVERASDREELKRCLLPDPQRRVTRPVFVLYGLGGIGKTQLAADFAQRHQRDFDSVFWLDAGSEYRLKQSLASYAYMILAEQFAGIKKADFNGLAEDVLRWLARPENGNWLLVLDDIRQECSHDGASGTGYIQRYLPGNHGSVLITTRLSHMSQLGNSKLLEKVDQDMSKAILEKWCGKSDLLNSDELLELFDGLPLALAQVGSYLRETGLDAVSFVRLYRQNCIDMMIRDEESSSLLVDYPQRSINTTWQSSIRTIEAENKDAVKLILFWSCIDNKDLWYGLFQAAAMKQAQLPGWLYELASNEVGFLRVMRLLLRHSIIEKQQCDSYSMHLVVHRWVSSLRGISEMAEYFQLAITVVGCLVPANTEKQFWLLQKRILPHAERCSSWLKHNFRVDLMLGNLAVMGSIHTLGDLYADQGRLCDAEDLYWYALDMQKSLLGINHASTIGTVRKLGNVYYRQGRLAEAQVMHKQAQQKCENALGPEHALTLDLVNDCANLCADHGCFEEAEEKYYQALEGKKRTLGLDHPSTLNTLNDLGVLYASQGRWEEAEQRYLQALDGHKRVLGPKHTFALCTINNLGVLYADQGWLKEAEAKCRDAFAGYQEALGLSHPLTINVIHNIGSILKDQGLDEDAEWMYRLAATAEKRTGLQSQNGASDSDKRGQL